MYAIRSYYVEEGENLSVVIAEAGVTTQYVTDGVTNGSRAIRVNVGALDADYRGIVFNDSGSWDFGEYSYNFV